MVNKEQVPALHSPEMAEVIREKQAALQKLREEKEAADRQTFFETVSEVFGELRAMTPEQRTAHLKRLAERDAEANYDSLRRKADAEAAMGLLGDQRTLWGQKLYLERLGQWNAERSLSLSGLGRLDSRLTLATYRSRKGYPSVTAAFEQAKEYIKTRGELPFLTFTGLPGVGKSHLVVAIGREFCRMGYFVLYREERNVLRDFRNAIQENGVDPTRDYERCDLLVLDDLGTEPGTDWAKAKLDAVIDYRYQGRLPTVIATNAVGDELSDRLASRLRDVSIGKVITIAADDYRLGKP